MDEVLRNHVRTYVGINLDGPHELRVGYLKDVTPEKLVVVDPARRVTLHIPLSAVLRVVEADQGTKLMTASSRSTALVIHLLHNAPPPPVASSGKTQRQTWVGFGWTLDG